MAAIALGTQGCATPKPAGSHPVAHSQRASASPAPHSRGASPRRIKAETIESYSPITVKAGSSPSGSGSRTTRRTGKATVRSIPTGADYEFHFNWDYWPGGLSSTSAKVRVYSVTITEDSDRDGASMSWDANEPLPVFPGSNNKSKTITMTKANNPDGFVKINIPSEMAGQNFMLLISKNLSYDGTDYHLGGGQIFSTAP